MTHLLDKKAQIDNFLTNDPKNKQGEIGTIISIKEIDDEDYEFRIKFDDGVVGIYEQDTFEIL